MNTTYRSTDPAILQEKINELQEELNKKNAKKKFVFTNKHAIISQCIILIVSPFLIAFIFEKISNPYRDATTASIGMVFLAMFFSWLFGYDGGRNQNLNTKWFMLGSEDKNK